MSTTTKKPRAKKFKPSLETWRECTKEQQFHLAWNWYAAQHGAGQKIQAMQQVSAWESKRNKLTDIAEKLQCDEQIEAWTKKANELERFAWFLECLLYELGKRPDVIDELTKEWSVP